MTASQERARTLTHNTLFDRKSATGTSVSDGGWTVDVRLRRSMPSRAVGVLALVILMSTVSRAGTDDPPAKLAMRGYCPVSYFTLGKAIRGTEAHKSVLMGKSYQFAGAEAKKLFDADPEKYAPQFDGWCALSLGGIKELRNIPDPNIFEIFNDKLYLFASERHRAAFLTKKEEFLEIANDRFVALDGFCPVSYQKGGSPVPGDPKLKVIYDGHAYHLSSPEAMKSFREHPARYLPQYRGYCALALAGNRRYAGDQKTYSLIDGRMFIFQDAESKSKFDADAKETIKKADANWAILKDWE